MHAWHFGLNMKGRDRLKCIGLDDVYNIYEKFTHIFLEKTKRDRFEDKILVGNLMLKQYNNIKTEIGLRECERYSSDSEWGGLEVIAEKIKYKVMSRVRNAEKNNNIKIGNKSFERMERFKYLGTTLTDQNSIHVEIKRRLKSGNAFYNSVQDLLSSNLLF
jgi:hypothetical protein